MGNKIDMKELAKFIKDSVATLRSGSATCCRMDIDGESELSFYVGWLRGYDENDKSLYNKDGYTIVVGVMNRNVHDFADFEYLKMPVYKNNCDVFDTQFSLDKADAKNGFIDDAKSLINLYNQAREGLDKGELKLM